MAQVMSKRGKMRDLEPGELVIGTWAHVKYHEAQHIVRAFEPDVDPAEPVRFACGKRYWRSAVWHSAPEPHLPKCKACERTLGRHV